MGPKKLGKKISGSKKFCVHKNFKPKKSGQKIFRSKWIFVQKMFLATNFWGQTNIKVKRSLDQKKIHRPKLRLPKIWSKRLVKFQVSKSWDKLGLNWAKLSSNWNWALLSLRFAALHWWLPTNYHYISWA